MQKKKVFGLVIIFNYIVWTGSLSPDLPRANKLSLARLYIVNFIGLSYKTNRLRKEMNRTYVLFLQLGRGARYLTGENLEVVWAEFSSLRWAV